MQAPIRGLMERSGEVFLLDILSHRMSVTGCYDRNAGWLLDGSMAQLGCVLGSPKEEKDEQEPDCFCFLARLRSRGARISVGAAKGRISYRLDQR